MRRRVNLNSLRLAHSEIGKWRRYRSAFTEHYSVGENVKDLQQKHRKSCQKRQRPMSSACLVLNSAKTVSD